MLNRARPVIQNLSTSEQTSQTQEKLDEKIEELLQKHSISQSLADSFPEWDLNPPNVLVRRRRSLF